MLTTIVNNGEPIVVLSLRAGVGAGARLYIYREREMYI